VKAIEDLEIRGSNAGIFKEVIMKKRFKIGRGTVLAFLSSGLILLSGILLLSACGGEKARMTQEIAENQEKIKSQENQINEDAARIKKLEEENKNLSSRLPVGRDVVPGDSHWKIAHDFLTSVMGIPADKASDLLSRAVLFDKILVGFKVWNYYADGIFGTFLTQGQAAVSPGALQRMEKLERERESQKLRDEISGLSQQLADMEKRGAAEREKWKSENEALQNRIKGLTDELATAQQKSRDLDVLLNSVYYLAGTKNSLKASGKIKGSFLGLCGDRLANVTAADFQKSLDIRGSESIALGAQELGVPTIRGVEILPQYFEENKDYRIEISADKKTATVHLLNKDKFRLARVVLVLN
jgi:flagellar motility protein MotE (MotC chaperone)